MSPADIAHLATLAHNVKHLTWDIRLVYQGAPIEYIDGPRVASLDPGDEVEGTIEYDALPADIRELCAAVPRLVAKVESLERSIALAILDGA